MAETGASNITTLNGLFKVVYHREIVNAIPDNAILQKRFGELSAAEKVGAEYRMPVVLSHEGGITYLGESGDLADLNSAVSMQMKEVTVKGSEMNLRGLLTYKALAASLGGSEKAFKKSTSQKVFGMNASIRHRIECSMLYGQSGLGTLSTVTDLGSNVAELVITDATWAPGIWIGTEGHSIDSFTGTAKNNSSGALVITKVDLDSKKLTVTYTGTLSNEAAAGDDLYFTGSAVNGGTFNEMVGLKKIITNSGSLFGINAGSYSLWKGNTVSSAGDASFGLLQDTAVKPANRGCAQKLVALVPTKFWTSLNKNESALRQYDVSYGDKAKNGFRSLSFYAANGELEIVRHPMVKEGEFFLLPEDCVVRVGSTDVTFSLDGESFFRPLEKQNGFMLECLTDQAIFLTKPSYAAYASGVTYS
jgi:hypothetical protein